MKKPKPAPTPASVPAPVPRAYEEDDDDDSSMQLGQGGSKFVRKKKTTFADEKPASKDTTKSGRLIMEICSICRILLFKNPGRQ